MALNPAQQEQLLRPLNSSRIARRRQGNSGPQLSYLEAWDVKAHLTRIFGFGGWSSEVIEQEFIYEEAGKGSSGKNYEVAYRVRLRLTIHRIRTVPDGGLDDGDAVYTEVAVGGASLPTRWEAHDMAVKTAESDALKRAAINLGTQFGLSLYDNGATRDVIGRTLSDPTAVRVRREGEQKEDADVQQGITQATEPTDGDDPNVKQHHDDDPGTQASQPPDDTPGVMEWIQKLKDAVAEHDVTAIVQIKKDATAAKVTAWTFQGVTVAKWCDNALVKAGKK